ncbi:MAG: response regulator [Candidatus Omnitrophica bacterium]|nr:response regulator [Candidatus Omnitrophota bacterium]
MVVKQGLEYLGASVLHGPTGERGLELARSEAIDLIVLDVSLPKSDGFAICKALKDDPGTRDIPVIFLSALNETKERVRGLRLGAIDYVAKPFDMDELVARIDIGLRVKANTNVQPSTEPEPESRTTHSEESLDLADILSNDEFLKLLEDRFKKLDPESGLLTLMFIRVDQEDHLLGEEHSSLRKSILEAVFSTLSELCPRGSSLGRVNPFQVGALLPRKNKYGAELIADELRNLVELKDFRAENELNRLTLSCGVAEIPSPIITTAKEFEELANSALYRAMQNGGNRTVLL